MVWQAAVSDLRRLRQIAGVLGRHGFDEVAARLWFKAAPAEGEAPLDTSDSEDVHHVPPARRIRLVLQDLGPTFIKLGQVLSTRPDLLPRDVLEELAFLQDQVDRVPTDAIRASIEAALGRPVDELFEGFEDEPLATASIAQTHRARLGDGTPVALKVQRPDIADKIYSDLDLLRGLAHLLEATVEEARIYDPVGIVAAFEAAITDELDFRLELGHMNEFHANFEGKGTLVVPRPFPELSARTVMTMEFLDGVALSALPAEGRDRAGLASTIIDGWYQMIFVDGLFHADPHPGNFLVLDGDRLALLDYGLVGRLTDDEIELLTLLGLGIFMKDVGGLARVIMRVGAPEMRVSLAAFRHEIQTLLDRYVGVDLDDVDTGSLLTELFDVAMRYGIRVPPQYALLAKAGGTLEGVIRKLHPDLNPYEVAGPYARKLIADRFAPERLVGQAVRTGLGLASFLQDVPAQLDQIMLDLESGKLTVRIEHPALDEIGKQLNSAATRVFFGCVAGGLLVAAGILVAPWQDRLGGFPWLGLLALLAVGGLCLAAVAWHVAVTVPGKIRLRDWITFWRRLRARRRAPKG